MFEADSRLAPRREESSGCTLGGHDLPLETGVIFPGSGELPHQSQLPLPLRNCIVEFARFLTRIGEPCQGFDEPVLVGRIARFRSEQRFTGRQLASKDARSLAILALLEHEDAQIVVGV